MVKFFDVSIHFIHFIFLNIIVDMNMKHYTECKINNVSVCSIEIVDE
jgi:hypothetical protein